ncbi:MAG: hypothetical protein LBQ57_03285 [Spirochaetales bacterium]|nr:hypothetical protein [Spirochaetales bacterium]
MKNAAVSIMILAAALAGCSSGPQDTQTGGISAPAASSGSLTGTWKLTEADSSQIMEFRPDGTGILNVYDANGQVTKTSALAYSFEDDSRYAVVGEQWVSFVSCEVREGRLTVKASGKVFTKQ